MKKIQSIEIIIAILFTILGGYADAYTFVIRGGTFATMQTGNLIKFFINLANGQFLLMFLLPIIFFCLGGMLAVLLSKFKYYRPIAISLLFVIYLASSFCPKNEAWDIVCVSSLSIAGALQFEAFHHCLSYSYTSTMCTNNMRLFSTNLVQGKIRTALFYLMIIACFILGIIASVFISKAMDIYALVPISSLFIVIFILYNFIPKERKLELQAE